MGECWFLCGDENILNLFALETWCVSVRIIWWTSHAHTLPRPHTVAFEFWCLWWWRAWALESVREGALALTFTSLWSWTKLLYISTRHFLPCNNSTFLFHCSVGRWSEIIYYIEHLVQGLAQVNIQCQLCKYKTKKKAISTSNLGL